MAAQQKSSRSYADVVNLATQLRNTLEVEDSNQDSADDTFIPVTNKWKHERLANKATNKFLWPPKICKL